VNSVHLPGLTIRPADHPVNRAGWGRIFDPVGRCPSAAVHAAEHPLPSSFIRMDEKTPQQRGLSDRSIAPGTKNASSRFPAEKIAKSTSLCRSFSLLTMADQKGYGRFRHQG